MAKAKAAAVKEEDTVKRQATPKPAPEVFTEFFRNDAQNAAQIYLDDNPDFKVISVVESDAGDAGTTVTITYK